MKPLTLIMSGLIALSLLTALDSGRATPKHAAEITDTEYEVISVYVADAYSGEKLKNRISQGITNLVISDKSQTNHEIWPTTGYDLKPRSWEGTAKYLRDQCPALQPSALESFRAINAHSKRFHHNFHLPLRYSLENKTAIDEMYEIHGSWDDFYAFYPHSQGLLTLSRVGFSPDGMQAVFYASNHCSWECGTDAYVVMEKSASGWKVTKEILVGQS